MYSNPRGSRSDELSNVVRLANRVFGSGGFEMGSAFPTLFNEANAEQLRVIDDDGQIVSHVGISIQDAVLYGVPVRTACIGAVCTDPGHRGRGLASLLMEDARAHVLSRGVDLMLISGGRGLYHRLGYVQVGRFPVYRVGPERTPSAITVTEYTPADLPAVMSLHAREPVRFRRSTHDWEQLLRAGKLICQSATLWVARLSGHAVATLAVQHPERNRRGELQPAGAQEYAGDRWAIAEATPEIIARMSAPSLDLVGPAGDPALAAQAAARGWESEIRPFGGTLAVIRPRPFLANLAPWIQERLGPEAAHLRIQATEQDARFEFAGESYAVDTPGRLAALLFGGDTPESRDIPPLTGRIGEVLRTLFPMPLLSYGYSFV